MKTEARQAITRLSDGQPYDETAPGSFIDAGCVSFQLQTHEVVEVCAKILYQVELRRSNLDTMWGFSVEAELVENSEKQDELCCYVSRVEDRSVAMNSG